jgi:hypothetical protein
MAKDRFNNKNSYDYEHRYGVYEPSLKSKRSTTYTQTKLLKEMYRSEKLNVWEKGFVKRCLTFYILSDKQKTVLNQLFLKLKR